MFLTLLKLIIVKNFHKNLNTFKLLKLMLKIMDIAKDVKNILT